MSHSTPSAKADNERGVLSIEGALNQRLCYKCVQRWLSLICTFDSPSGSVIGGVRRRF